MTKTAKTTETGLLELDITERDWERCVASLRRKLRMAILDCEQTGDVGLISRLAADLRAMDFISPSRPLPAPETPPPLPADVKEKREAAEDPVKMRAYNAKIARKEAVDAARGD